MRARPSALSGLALVVGVVALASMLAESIKAQPPGTLKPEDMKP